MPILGTVASQFSSKPFGSFESIATTTLSSATGTITFSSIPSTFEHLQVRMVTRGSDGSNGLSGNLMRVNGDTGSNYTWDSVYGLGGSLNAGTNLSQTSMIIIGFVNGGNTANLFGVNIIDIHDYKNTNKYKTIRAVGGNGSSIAITSYQVGIWKNTNAITSLSFATDTAQFATNTQIALYGIKG
jgi:hypothetical protein